MPVDRRALARNPEYGHVPWVTSDKSGSSASLERCSGNFVTCHLPLSRSAPLPFDPNEWAEDLGRWARSCIVCSAMAACGG